MNRTRLLLTALAASLLLNVAIAGYVAGRSLLEDTDSRVLHLQHQDVTEGQLREHYRALRGGSSEYVDFLSTCEGLQGLSTEAQVAYLGGHLAGGAFMIENRSDVFLIIGESTMGKPSEPESVERALEILLEECKPTLAAGPTPIPPTPTAREVCMELPPSGSIRQPPSHPYLAGTLAIGPSGALVVEGDYAYISGTGGCILVVDVSDPSKPRLAGATRTDHNGQMVLAEGSDCPLEFDRNSGLPKPCRKPHYSGAGSPRIVGDTLYAAASGLQLFDISDPTSPEFIKIASPGAGFLDVEGDRLYAGGLSIYDITDPRNPAQITYQQFYGYSGIVDADRGYVYLRSGSAMHDGVQIVDARSPESPTVVGLIDAEGPGDKPHLAVADGIAYWLVNDFLTVADMSDPSAPVVMATMPVPPEAKNVFLADGFLYARFGPGVDEGLMVIDVTTPSAPVLKGTVRIGAVANGQTTIFADGDYAYVLAADHLQIIDVARLARDWR